LARRNVSNQAWITWSSSKREKLKHFKFLYCNRETTKYVFQVILIHFLLIFTESETFQQTGKQFHKVVLIRLRIISQEKLKHFCFSVNLEPYQMGPKSWKLLSANHSLYSLLGCRHGDTSCWDLLCELNLIGWCNVSNVAASYVLLKLI
jgi:hypothetical protein